MQRTIKSRAPVTETFPTSINRGAASAPALLNTVRAQLRPSYKNVPMNCAARRPRLFVEEKKDPPQAKPGADPIPEIRGIKGGHDSYQCRKKNNFGCSS